MATVTHDPVAAAFDALTPAPVHVVLATMRAARDAISALPAPPPPWLHRRHAPLLGRVLQGLAVRRIALLAAPTGHGKTWVALAAHAMRHPARAACVVAPAALRAQWLAIAGELHVPVQFLSHERLSRGPTMLPPGQLVIVDEAHRFRTPSTRRHRHLADALHGHEVLLLTATPVVNRLDDLAALLQLAARDDVLARDGVPSLQRMLQRGDLHPALTRLVHVPGTEGVGPRVERRSVQRPLTPATRAVLAGLDALQFSSDTGVAALLRTTAERALASSHRACAAVLARYSRLLQHARDAAAAGRPLARADVLRATAGLGDQLLFWSLLPETDATADLALDDADRLPPLLTRLTDDASDLDTLISVLAASSEPTVVFTAWRATARALVHRLGARTAWVTGSGSGIGPVPLPRRAVLSHFGAGAALPRAPHLLVATDVAAEGLDLPRLRRVVHADLPWTPMRLTQREGRARRAGSTATTISVVTAAPPRELEVRLGLEARLQRKAVAGERAAAAAIDTAWQLDFGAVPSQPATRPCIAALLEHGSSASQALCAFVNEQHELSLVAVTAEGQVVESAEQLNVLLHAARRATASAVATPLPSALRYRVADECRRQLALRTSSAWRLDPPAPDARLVGARLTRLGSAAVRRRDFDALALLDRALRWCGRGHAGADRRVLAALAALEGPALFRRLQELDRDGRFATPAHAPPPSIRLIAVIGFIRSARGATFGACPPHARSSSTSTAR